MSFSFMGRRWGDLPDDDDEGSWCNSEPPCASDTIDIAVAATMSVEVDVTAPHEKMLSVGHENGAFAVGTPPSLNVPWG